MSTREGYARPPVVVLEHAISSVDIMAGMAHTAWLGSMHDEPGRTQVELRVLPDGTREVWVDGPVVLRTSFADWEPMSAPEPTHD